MYDGTLFLHRLERMPMRFRWLALFSFVIIGLAIFLRMQKDEITVPSDHSLQVAEPCEFLSFEGSQFTVCTVDPKQHRIELVRLDPSGKPWGSLKRFVVAQSPLFAMNAGMYHEDLSPVGLYIERGAQIRALNLEVGLGNFFMKPNGVFGVNNDGKPFVQTSEDYANLGVVPVFATQSGPMLVIDGQIHPRFEPDGTSRNIRNGVGINQNGQVFFVISREPVSFGKFARLYRDGLNCQNALYFDGVVSAFAQNDSIVQGGAYPAGAIVAVIEKSIDMTKD
jgi:uncharacterized protein YigE (DUF2233 family)